MKYVITENQYNLLKEYFDPIYFLKKKMSKEPRQIKPEHNIKYEEDFQKYVNIIFKLTYKLNPLEHLKGFEVTKVTPSEKWTVVLKPKIDDWFNYCDNSDYQEKLEKFEQEFKTISRMTMTGSPFSEEGYPQDVYYTFWNYC
jgi:hypothetical protein